MVSDNEHFQALWDYGETDRRRYILWLVHELESGQDVRVSGELLSARLVESGIRASTDDVDEDLKFLVELELVKLEQDRIGLPSYRCAVPLMRRWMTENIDPEAQRRSTEREGSARALGLTSGKPPEFETLVRKAGVVHFSDKALGEEERE